MASLSIYFIGLVLFVLRFPLCIPPHFCLSALCPPSFRRLSPKHCFPSVARRGRSYVTVSDVVRLLLQWPCDRRLIADRVTVEGLISLTNKSRCVDDNENSKKDFFLRWSSCLWDQKQKLVLTRDPRRRLRAESEAGRGRPQMVMLGLVLHLRTVQGLVSQRDRRKGQVILSFSPPLSYLPCPSFSLTSNLRNLSLFSLVIFLRRVDQFR